MSGSQPSAGTSSVVKYIVLALLAVLVVEIPLVAWWQVSNGRKTSAELAKVLSSFWEAQEARRAKLAEKEKANRLGRVVKKRDTLSDCYATNSLVTCHFTNLQPTAVVLCLQGVIVQKEAAGVRLYSMPICSGPVSPKETKSVSAPWEGGRAKNICKGRRGYLDWDKCDFNVIDYEKK